MDTKIQSSKLTLLPGSILKLDDHGDWWLETANAPATRVFTVGQTVKLLKKSRRQIYRDIESGALPAVGKVWGEWLIAENSVAQLKNYPSKTQPVPSSLAWLFPEYDLSELNLGRHEKLVLSRVMELGGLKEVKWALHRFSKASILRYLNEDESSRLSRRSLVFWKLYFNVKTKTKSNWRSKNNLWINK